jgi:DNA-binding beta-propeller fold protein YncE
VNHKIRCITSNLVVSTIAGNVSGYIDAVGTNARFNQPQGIAVDAAGVIYIADTVNRRVRVISPAFVVTTLAGSISGSINGFGTAALFSSPAGISVDAAGAFVYVADANKIRKITVCAPGSHLSSGADACALCPAGTFSPSLGANSSAACAPCAAGAFSVAGAPSCAFTVASCPVSTFANGSAACAACAPATACTVPGLRAQPPC